MTSGLDYFIKRKILFIHMPFIVKNARVIERIVDRCSQSKVCVMAPTQLLTLSFNQGRLKKRRASASFSLAACAHLSLHVDCRETGNSQNRLRGILLCLS